MAGIIPPRPRSPPYSRAPLTALSFLYLPSSMCSVDLGPLVSPKFQLPWPDSSPLRLLTRPSCSHHTPSSVAHPTCFWVCICDSLTHHSLLAIVSYVSHFLTHARSNCQQSTPISIYLFSSFLNIISNAWHLSTEPISECCRR